MQVHQILIRPDDNLVVILYKDIVGNRNSLHFDSSGNAKVAAIVEECQGRLPQDEERPDKTEIEQEIDELEYRLSQLKESIGAG